MFRLCVGVIFDFFNVHPMKPGWKKNLRVALLLIGIFSLMSCEETNVNNDAGDAVMSNEDHTYRLYLDADGDDENDGQTSATAVQHLWRIHEILWDTNNTLRQGINTPIEILIDSDTHYKQMVRNDTFIRWTYFNPNGHRIVFKPLHPNGPRPVFDGESGLGPVDSWTPSKLFFHADVKVDSKYETDPELSCGNTPSRLEFHGLHIQNYWKGGIFIGRSNCRSLSHNVFRDNVFENIGLSHAHAACQDTDGNSCFAVAAIDLMSSHHNLIDDNTFLQLENVVYDDLCDGTTSSNGGPCCEHPCHRTKVHGVYVAYESHHNMIRNNFFERISGDPVKVKDEANFNVVMGNYFSTYNGTKAHFLDKSAKSGDECLSWQNLVYNNVHSDGTYACIVPGASCCIKEPAEVKIDEVSWHSEGDERTTCNLYSDLNYGWHRVVNNGGVGWDYNDEDTLSESTYSSILAPQSDLNGDGRDAFPLVWEDDAGRTNISVLDWAFKSGYRQTQFGWHSDSETDIAHRSQWFSTYVHNQKGFAVTGDFNGDSQNEIAVLWQWPEQFTETGEKSNTSGHTQVTTLVTDSWHDWMEIETKNVTSQNRWLETYLAMDKGFLRVGDYDGDGDDELAALWQWSSGRTNITSFNSTPGFGWKSTYRSNLSEKSYWLDNAVLNNQGFVLSGDYNGDAQDELAVLWQTPQPESSERNPQTHITIFDAPVDFQWSETNHEVGLANFLEAYVRNGKGFVRTGDFDGDGKDEIGVLWQDGDGWTNITLLDMVNDQAWDPIDAPNVLNASVGETEWLDSKVRNGQGYVLVGDHNGNGTDAFIVLSKTEDEMMEITLFENPGGAGWDISTTAEHAAKLSWNDIGLLSVIDIDNDNRAEVVSVFENESKVNIQSWDWRGPDGHAGIDEGQVGNTAILSGAYLAISQRRVGPQ